MDNHVASDPKQMVGVSRRLNQPAFRWNPGNCFVEHDGTSRKHCNRGPEFTHEVPLSIGSFPVRLLSTDWQLIIQGILRCWVNMPNRSAQKISGEACAPRARRIVHEEFVPLLTR